jgi:hypothetical protein
MILCLACLPDHLQYKDRLFIDMYIKYVHIFVDKLRTFVDKINIA